jgi:hypothetical protein
MTSFDADWLPDAFLPLLFKLSRANHLCNELADLLLDLGEQDVLDLVTVVRDGKSICHLRGVVTPPPAIGLVFGDAINQLRSALDHAVLMIVEQERGETLSSKLSQRTSFPVCRDPKAFTKWCEDRSKALPQLAPGSPIASRLEALQPFHPSQIDPEASSPTHDSTATLFLTPTSSDGQLLVEHHPLAGLAAWSNEDKHRRLNVAILRSVFQGIMPDPAYHPSPPEYEWLASGHDLIPGTDLWAVSAGSTMVADVHPYAAIMRPETRLWRPPVSEINIYQRWVGETALPFLITGKGDTPPLPPDLCFTQSMEPPSLKATGGDGYVYRSQTQSRKIAQSLRRAEERAAMFTESYFGDQKHPGFPQPQHRSRGRDSSKEP